MKRLLIGVLVLVSIFTLTSCQKYSGSKYHLTGDGSNYYYSFEYVTFNHKTKTMDFYFAGTLAFSYEYSVKGNALSIKNEETNELVEVGTISRKEMVINNEELNNLIKTKLLDSQLEDVYKNSNDSYFVITTYALKLGKTELK